MDVNSIGSVGGGMPIRKVSQPMPAQQPMEARPVVPKDVVEISSTSSVSGKMEIEADFRAQRLAQIRQQIEDGSYETADKLDTAVDRLLEKLRSE